MGANFSAEIEPQPAGSLSRVVFVLLSLAI